MDLDAQTVAEYNRFQKGSANSNVSTAVLKRQLEDPEARIVVTTIQKLSQFIKGNAGHAIYSGHIVIVFDECHRSQFGDMHKAITKAFKQYNIFGFTGTPIFTANAAAGPKGGLQTTEQTFGDQLHSYTIVDAITDKNVLPFRIDYINTVEIGQVRDKQVSAIDTEQVMLDPRRIEMVTRYILDNFDRKTKRNSSYMHQGKRKHGFNALFATASIDAAKRYYNMFARLQIDTPAEKRLKVALIYSYGPNQQAEDGTIEEESFSTELLSATDQEFLADAISDYNEMFGQNFDTSAKGFEYYFTDLSTRLKNQEIDLVIVVNMFLTGFDAPTLNTLFVDKNLQSHGLIQAYSRTNRILNSVKTYGNIVSFRNLEQQTTEAIALFGNKEASGIVLLKPYSEYLHQYRESVQKLQSLYPDPSAEVPRSETVQRRFVQIFGRVLRLLNILSSFDDFAADDVLTEREKQDYRSRYMDIYEEWHQSKGDHVEREDIRQDVIFELELVKQVEINVDYILSLVEQRQREQDQAGEAAGAHAGAQSSNKHGSAHAEQEIREQITRSIDSSPSLRNKKDLIEEFVDKVSLDTSVQEQWRAYVAERKEAELAEIISQERLNDAEARSFMTRAFRAGEVRESGTAIVKILPAVSMFAAGAGAREEQKKRVLERLKHFFERFAPLISD
ncbi:MAG: HsdR family type I site-specific deoxyribonuclease [Actinomycetaceae bacterium]|nr:HsdR family type I site-specific deoxyribonuclease [Actinomycetaceae bacterium]